VHKDVLVVLGIEQVKGKLPPAEATLTGRTNKFRDVRCGFACSAVPGISVWDG